jgi:hypothetical protein
METGVTRAAANKKVRQEALREQLSSQGHVQKVIENINKLEDPTIEVDVPRLKAAIDSRMKLINKYLPDLKATEHTGSIDSDQTHTHRVTFRNRK